MMLLYVYLNVALNQKSAANIGFFDPIPLIPPLETVKILIIYKSHKMENNYSMFLSTSHNATLLPTLLYI